VPATYRGLVSLEGSGDARPESLRQCLLNRAALVSGRDGLQLTGGGIRLGLKQSLITAGRYGLDIQPGDSGRANVQCQLDHSSVAARSAALHLSEAKASTPAGAVVVQTRACAFLNPFPAHAGMLLYESDALPRGILLWQGDNDLYDKRLYFAAAPGTPPDRSQPLSAWTRLWGSANCQHSVIEDRLARPLEGYPWPLERLILPRAAAGHGADLGALGISRRPG
jgi:hypothetical protein